MPDYIPTRDDEFNTYVTTKFVPYATSNAVALGLAPADTSALNSAAIAWGYAWTGFQNFEAEYRAAVEDKDIKHESL